MPVSAIDARLRRAAEHYVHFNHGWRSSVTAASPRRARMCIFSRDLTPIGIDLGSRYVKAAQLSRSRGRWRVHAAAVVPLGMPQAALNVEVLVRLRVQLKAQGFSG